MTYNLFNYFIPLIITGLVVFQWVAQTFVTAMCVLAVKYFGVADVCIFCAFVNVDALFNSISFESARTFAFESFLARIRKIVTVCVGVTIVFTGFAFVDVFAFGCNTRINVKR